MNNKGIFSYVSDRRPRHCIWIQTGTNLSRPPCTCCPLKTKFKSWSLCQFNLHDDQPLILQRPSSQASSAVQPRHGQAGTKQLRVIKHALTIFKSLCSHSMELAAWVKVLVMFWMTRLCVATLVSASERKAARSSFLEARRSDTKPAVPRRIRMAGMAY